MARYLSKRKSTPSSRREKAALKKMKEEGALTFDFLTKTKRRK